MARHVIRPGECVSTLAARHRLEWKAIWDHPENAALRRLRSNPNLVAPGDEVFVPDVEPKQLQGATGQAHHFVVSREAVTLRLRLVASGEPVANAGCTLEADGCSVAGRTDGDGVLEVAVPAELRRARLVVDDRPDAWWIEIGALPPPDGVEGARARLRNLGYHVGTGSVRALDEATRGAIAEFQRAHGLEPTAELDDVTLRTLVQAHGC